MDGPPFYPDDYLTVREAAHQLNVSPGSIYLQIKNNELTVRKRGRMYFLPKKQFAYPAQQERSAGSIECG